MTAPIVVKLGSSLVVGPGGRTRRSLVTARAAEIAALSRKGVRTCIVSSGAIALGVPRLGAAAPPRDVPHLQAASALGQVRLQLAWDTALGKVGLHAAQVLLTAHEIADRASYLNARNSLNALLGVGAVPIVNENDATATDEITFGDNDALAAHVATLVSAQVLVLLTQVEGLYTRVPGTPGAELIADGRDAAAAELGPNTGLGKGGMRSKVVAAEMAASAGIPTVIAGGEGDDVLGAILAGEQRGTRFEQRSRGLSSYKLWLLYGKPVAGRLVVDEGARRAVAADGRSLLAVGVTACDGTFEAGDGVELVGPEGVAFAKGVAGASAAEIAGRPHDLEAVHRDRLVLY
ncbi:MAG: glutamate 5-kinase [Gaiellales bacterium]